MIFHATIKKQKGGYEIQFIELPNILTFCKKKSEIPFVAKDALIGCVASDLDQLLDIPQPRRLPIRNKNLISVSLPLNLSCAILFRKLRKKNNLTTKDIAKKLGISRQAYERLESSHANPSVETIERVLLAHHYDHGEFIKLAA